MEALMDAITGRDTTVTVNDLESLRLGDALLATRTIIMFVVLASASLVMKMNTPFVGLMVAPPGAPGSRLKLSGLPG